MKSVIWSDKSVDSLELIYDYIFEKSPKNSILNNFTLNFNRI